MRTKWLFIGYYCLFLAGCQQRIEYVVKNAGPQTIHDVLVKSDSRHSCLHGILIPESHKSYSGPMNTRAENQLTISWKEESGKEHVKVLSVSKKTLRDKKVRVFTINAAMEIEEGWRWGNKTH